MIAYPAGAKVWIAGGATETRGGMNRLALKVHRVLGDPHSHEVFCFRGCKCDLIKVIWHDGPSVPTTVRHSTV